jgi:hypothetical protein
MAALTDAEKAAGRVFLAERKAAWEALPKADIRTPVHGHHVRHVCPALGKSVGIETKEVYQPSEDGRFAFIYREGRCADCRMTARSGMWRLVDARSRAPLGRS